MDNDTKYDVMLELYLALKELTELKDIKEQQGETEDYIKRKPLAWATAKRIVAKHKEKAPYWGVKA